MKCDACGRDNLTERELAVHIKYFHKPRNPTEHQQAQQLAAGACPECGTTLWYQEGCIVCKGCGFNKCD